MVRCDDPETGRELQYPEEGKSVDLVFKLIGKNSIGSTYQRKVLSSSELKISYGQWVHLFVMDMGMTAFAEASRTEDMGNGLWRARIQFPRGGIYRVFSSLQLAEGNFGDVVASDGIAVNGTGNFIQPPDEVETKLIAQSKNYQMIWNADQIIWNQSLATLTGNLKNSAGEAIQQPDPSHWVAINIDSAELYQVFVDGTKVTFSLPAGGYRLFGCMMGKEGFEIMDFGIALKSK